VGVGVGGRGGGYSARAVDEGLHKKAACGLCREEPLLQRMRMCGINATHRAHAQLCAPEGSAWLPVPSKLPLRCVVRAYARAHAEQVQGGRSEADEARNVPRREALS
jgi:hypothetical protein